MRRLISLSLILLLALGLIACGKQNVDNLLSDDEEQGTQISLEASDEKELTDTGNNTTTVIIDANGITIRAELYDNQAARSFMKMLPYSITVSRAEYDLCGSVSEELDVNSEEDSNTWKIGEIGWFDGWFTILCDNEAGMRKRTRTIIGKIREEDVAILQSIKGSVNMTISLDDKNDDNYIMLNSGYKMPKMGLGTWTLTGETAEDSVYTALKDGYRLIDTAQYYGNETEVGKALKKAIDEGIVTREEVFITTKVMPGNYSDPAKSIDQSLERLGVDYIDLMLVHQSGPNDDGVYRALCQGVKDGKIHSIGISNYYTPAEFERVIKGADIKPAVVQNENHIFYQNTEFQEYVSRYKTIVESYYPFGGRGNTKESLNNETIVDLANKHNKTAAQIILRWHIQAGYIAIPGSSNPEHILENISVFDFELSDEEMKQIQQLNTGKRYENW